MKLLAALSIGTLIGLLLAFIVFVLVGGCADHLTGPMMGITLVLAVLLAVGLTEWLLFRRPQRHQDDPPRGHR